MMLAKWEDLPKEMQLEEVKSYYEILEKKKGSLLLKRIFDVMVSVFSLIIFFPVFVVLAIIIKIDSRGTVFYRQVRVTQYGKTFRIHKFRTMISDADKKGSHVTTLHDNRITKVGRVIRKYRLDEVSQLIDVLQGNMTFVGARPEAMKYVEAYTPEMMATLLLPAGITSIASIRYKDEAELLEGVDDVDKVYVENILPEKMKYNLESLKQFGFFNDLSTMLMTVAAVLKNGDEK